MKDRAAKIAVALVALVAVGRAVFATMPAPGKPLDAAGEHDAYRDIVSRERSMRREAAVKFPGDLWSADDDFHQREADAMRSFATSRTARLGDVIRAVDDGMHERWQGAGQPIATVPPCRPRLSY
ncbi:MAG TPA: hypothetical protein VGH28_04160 [Polyangiaceae bacterium]